MVIPKSINILGHAFKIVHLDVSDIDNIGTMDPKHSVIRLSTGMPQSVQESVLMHEIVEAINSHLELKLEHPQITALSTVIFQVLRENKMLK
jgi:hypothetical protein